MRNTLITRARLTVTMLALTAIGSACAASAPRQFTRTANESGIWKSVEISETLEKPRLWATVVDGLSSKYDLEVLDRESGYVRTSWKFTAVTNGKANENYRTRLITKFNPEWSVLQVKSEAQWLDGGIWISGYDTQVLDDIYGDLQGRLGRIRR